MHILLNKSLSQTLTGIEHSSLNRFKILKKMNYDVLFATLNFNVDLLEISKYYGIGDNEISNPYFLFLDQKKFSNKKFEINLEGLRKVEVKEKDFKVFRDKQLIMYVGYNASGELKFINYFDEKSNYKREFYIKSNKALEIHFNENKEKVREFYFDAYGRKAIEKKYNIESLSLESIILSYNNCEMIFENELSFLKHWLSETIDKKQKTYLYVDRPYRYNDLVLKLDKNNLKIIGIVHAIHYNHYRSHMVGNLLTGYKGYFENVGKFDAIVVGTELQKKDIADRFDIKKYIHVIPPSSLKFENQIRALKSNDLTFISVGRLAPEKRIDHILKAFKIVKDNGYSFIFNIFGSGSELAALKNIVLNLGLDESVKFKGYSKDILTEINNSHYSLVASAYEGFNISIIESFMCSTPVISYNVKYGPMQLIEDGYNGYLIDDDDVVQYANKLMEVISGKEDLNTMQENAYNSSLGFSDLIISEKWYKLLEMIDRN